MQRLAECFKISETSKAREEPETIKRKMINISARRLAELKSPSDHSRAESGAESHRAVAVVSAVT